MQRTTIAIGLALTFCVSAFAIAGCSKATSSGANAGSSASAGDIPVYPGATAAMPPGMKGTPPPDGRSYTTQDSIAQVVGWYKTKAPGVTFQRYFEQGVVFLAGDRKTGSVILIVAKGGKTWIISGPATMFGRLLP
jgi:hypothetical protein